MSLISLTRQERQVILFLIVIALLGLGINFLTKHFSQIRVIGYISQDIGKINLNQADKEALIDISGIGTKLAQRIIDYRQQKGWFRNITELKKIKGISESKYEAIKDYFIVD
ncbi:MAG: helix-hairpin-helix domain-containing protein [Candidatus Omnitrophica bacterium]|nr:helix-hairpin-helix domain-containing protein [Candidatus Omnitrophota bacterium]